MTVSQNHTFTNPSFFDLDLPFPRTLTLHAFRKRSTLARNNPVAKLSADVGTLVLVDTLATHRFQFLESPEPKRGPDSVVTTCIIPFANSFN